MANKDHKTRQKEYRGRHQARLQKEDRRRKRKKTNNIKTDNPELWEKYKQKDVVNWYMLYMLNLKQVKKLLKTVNSVEGFA